MIKTKIIGLLLILSSILIITNEIYVEKIALNKTQSITSTKINNIEDYYAILKIPKINLIRELYSTDSPENTLEHNLLVHDKSVFPNDKSISNVIIAGHSGTGSKALFKNLYKLTKNDTILLYYNDYLYKYSIIDIEKLPKLGNLNIKNYNNDTITLITCTKNDNKSQTIYYAKLENKAKIVKK